MTNSVKEVFIDFILKRTKDQGLDLKLNRVKTYKEMDYRVDFIFREIETDKSGNVKVIKTHQFKVLALHRAAKREWYRKFCFDSSMGLSDMKQTLIENPIEETITKYYPQRFTFFKVEYGVKWNVFNGDQLNL